MSSVDEILVSRVVAPGDTAVATVGSRHAGTRSNVIPGYAVLELNMRSYSAVTRQRMLDAIGRIVRAECQASGSPKDPEFETIFTFPVTDNDAAATGRVATAFEIPKQTVSEDFSKIPDAAHVPYCYWAIGFTDKQAYLAAGKAGTLDDLPTNHSPAFLPPLQPTLRTGIEALVTAALAWLAPH
jgi:metal-dependent amidase/aminoacylase/carboxypeptidase family protein